jgi:hypothetical protein
MLDDLRLDRIPVNVAHERMQVALLLDEESLISALEQVADSSMPAVEPFRVGGVQTRHHARKRNLAGAEGKVDVVAHEAIGQQAEPESLAVVSQAREVLVSVDVVAEYGSTLITARRDVV